MGGSGQSSDFDQYSLFLLDGLTLGASPLILLVTDASVASTVVPGLHAGSIDWDELPAARGRLLSLETSAAAELTSQRARAVCDELATTGDWLYVENVDALLRRSGCLPGPARGLSNAVRRRRLSGRP